MKGLLFGVASLVVTVACGVTPARIGEIAAWLPKEPAADGAHIDDRAKWDALAALPQAKEEVGRAEGLLDKPVPEVSDEFYLDFTRNGNRSRYQDQFYRRLYSFTSLFLAECYENKGRFIKKIVDYVDALCAQRSWTLPAHDGDLTCFNGTPHIDLMSGHISLELAFVVSWLGDRLPDATRAKVLAEIDRRTFQPYLATSRDPGKRGNRRHWWYYGGNNWNSVCNCCCVRTALALIEDRRLRAEFVESAERTVPYALSGYTEDGYCSEGMGYWNYGYGHHLTMGLSVRAATGGKVDFFKDPKCKKVMEYAYGYQTLHGISPHFADGGGNPSSSLCALGRQIWPDLVDTGALKNSVLRGGIPEMSLRAFGQEPAPVEPKLDVLPIRTWFPDAQVLLTRAAYPERTMNLGVAFKGGHNAELHNHNDVGSYSILLDFAEMAGDPGGEVYTRRTFSRDRYVSKVLNSYGHPVPVVGGQLQKTGRKHAAKVLRTEFTDTKDVIEIEYAAAYDVPALKSLVRTFTFDRAASSATITDKVVFGEPTAFEVPVITYRDYTKNDAASTFLFSKPHKQNVRKLKMNVTASAPVKFAEELIENPGCPSPKRLAFTFVEPVTEATFTTVFSSR